MHWKRRLLWPKLRVEVVYRHVDKYSECSIASTSFRFNKTIVISSLVVIMPAPDMGCVEVDKRQECFPCGAGLKNNQKTLDYTLNSHTTALVPSFLGICWCSTQILALGTIFDNFSLVSGCTAPFSTVKASQHKGSLIISYLNIKFFLNRSYVYLNAYS